MMDPTSLIVVGSTFSMHILNFSHDGAFMSLPPDAASKEALALEADYYGLDKCMHAI